jgi:hypothetical protein
MLVNIPTPVYISPPGIYPNPCIQWVVLVQEGLRAALRARVAEVQSLEAHVRSLEVTRDR